jgi:hypothetical protein
MKYQLVIEFVLIAIVVLLSAFWLWSDKGKYLAITVSLEKFLTILLGSFLVMAGMVKFFDPFYSMFAQQIILSGLPFPFITKWLGQLGEISAGVFLLTSFFITQPVFSRIRHGLFYVSSGLAVIIMLVAVYVHLLPQVPAEVLPLQSKPPIFTLIVMSMLLVNVYLHRLNTTRLLN